MKKMILGVVIGVLVGTASNVIASNLLASNIAYTPKDSTWGVNNVEAAIDSLKLSKTSDNYSTEEQVIGTWIDGKPIYQKIVVKNATISNSWQNYCNITDISENLETIIDARTYYNGKTMPVPMWGSQNGSIFRIIGPSGLSGMPISGIIFEYTKTTD